MQFFCLLNKTQYAIDLRTQKRQSIEIGREKSADDNDVFVYIRFLHVCIESVLPTRTE